MCAHKTIDLDHPRYDQNSYTGRAKHFFSVTNPVNVLASDEELDRAKKLCDDYQAGKLQIGVNVEEEELWSAKNLRDSAFHPDTGEKQFVAGRMSFQVPGNMLISGCMMTFYKSTPAVVFWQWVNQTFNCFVNYTNRNASVTITETQLAGAYAAACSASMMVAVGLNKLVALRSSWSNGLVGRLVPFVAVAAANCVNIPLMRQVELKNGIDVFTAPSNGESLGKSQTAAQSAVSQVVPSRIIMAVPGMVLPPIIMNKLSQKPFMKKMPFLAAPITIGLTGGCLFFATPLCCALFPQTVAVQTCTLESNIQEKARQANIEKAYYNKGL